ncbi:hypothetical protein BU23DRAFT_598859 [Bimuria novae-zelandiae CBS 107.79]|uniref:Uncharacterized protein n=1 Tax=Bimuria novae-zelandiae CBS 107.79 TaxID=1447943 RepID=A0A6A5V9F9_9PLEO|nr:hypothetical protein BU23DRAFT_598859 [Bimuria novae-zelandiae CBS 107.79]
MSRNCKPREDDWTGLMLLQARQDGTGTYSPSLHSTPISGVWVRFTAYMTAGCVLASQSLRGADKWRASAGSPLISVRAPDQTELSPTGSLPTKNKALSGDDNARGDREELAHAAYSVKVVNLTCLSYSKADYKISSSGRESNKFGNGASDDETSDDGDRADRDDWSGVGERDDDWSLPHRGESVNSEQNRHAGEIPFGTLKTLNQDYTAERDILSSIDDHRVHLMADDGEEGEYLSQRADPSARNTSGDLAPMLDKSEVIDLTDLGDESSDDDEGERERKCPLSRSRSSSVLQDAPCSARPAATQSPTLSPLSGNI